MITSNIQNLASSERGIKGRVTIDMLEDEPYAPVKNDNSKQNFMDEEAPHHKEENKEKDQENKKEVQRKSMVLCCTSVAFMVVFFLIDHIFQALRKFLILIKKF